MDGFLAELRRVLAEWRHFFLVSCSGQPYWVPVRKLRGPSGFTWKDYRDLVVRAHLQLGGPIVLIWDNLNVHRSAGMRQYAADHDWLTVIQLPSYAPQLNPVEGIWSLLRRSCTANVLFRDRDQLEHAIRRGLRRIQQHPDVINGCLRGTRLSPLPA
uniref:transposase n=1 Tax=Streptomyces lunaelactis TaxID=1535768 RepID=UPI0020C756B6|nr:transposase [Streptomyces lunaelactis]